MNDYGGYAAILLEALAERLREPSTACPRCGEPLDVNARGERNCPLGHYRDSGQPVS
jgi:hypothetical protein